MGPGFESLEVHQTYSSIAQSVERMTVNHDVTGSSPVRGAKEVGFTDLFFIFAECITSDTRPNNHYSVWESGLTGILCSNL